VKKFQELCLILNPMLQEEFVSANLVQKKRTYFLTPLSSQYVQDIVDEVNRKYEERRGKKAGMDWTMYGVHI
jgi:hypothetical protein